MFFKESFLTRFEYLLSLFIILLLIFPISLLEVVQHLFAHFKESCLEVFLIPSEKPHDAKNFKAVIRQLLKHWSFD